MRTLKHPFKGEFWNVDRRTKGITRFRFYQRGGRTYVEGWASSFPTDLEWGEADLTLLCRKSGITYTREAFAAWDNDYHCIFKIKGHRLQAEYYRSYCDGHGLISTDHFQKSVARSAAAKTADPVDRFSKMWEASKRGWKLIQYSEPVYLIKISFKESGPTRRQLAAVIDCVGQRSRETPEHLFNRMRGCTGIYPEQPMTLDDLKDLRRRQRQTRFGLRVERIATDDVLVLQPDGSSIRGLFFQDIAAQWCREC